MLFFVRELACWARSKGSIRRPCLFGNREHLSRGQQAYLTIEGGSEVVSRLKGKQLVATHRIYITVSVRVNSQSFKEKCGTFLATPYLLSLFRNVDLLSSLFSPMTPCAYLSDAVHLGYLRRLFEQLKFRLDANRISR